MYRCNRCDAVFSSRNTLSRHKNIHKDPIHVCKDCSKAFNRLDNLRRHEKIHIREINWKESENENILDDDMSVETETNRSVPMVSTKIKDNIMFKTIENDLSLDVFQRKNVTSKTRNEAMESKSIYGDFSNQTVNTFKNIDDGEKYSWDMFRVPRIIYDDLNTIIDRLRFLRQSCMSIREMNDIVEELINVGVIGF